MSAAEATLLVRTRDDLAAMRQRLDAARREVAAVSRGPRDGGREWTMRIPAQPHDSDMVLASALDDLEVLLKDREARTAAVASPDGLLENVAIVERFFDQPASYRVVHDTSDKREHVLVTFDGFVDLLKASTCLAQVAREYAALVNRWPSAEEIREAYLAVLSVQSAVDAHRNKLGPIVEAMWARVTPRQQAPGTQAAGQVQP